MQKRSTYAYPIIRTVISRLALDIGCISFIPSFIIDIAKHALFSLSGCSYLGNNTPSQNFRMCQVYCFEVLDLLFNDLHLLLGDPL
jgi:hypothetical protein